MIFHRNTFHGYVPEDDDGFEVDPLEEFHYPLEPPLSKEEVRTLYRFAKHVVEHGDEVPFDWPADQDPRREIRIRIDE